MCGNLPGYPYLLKNGNVSQKPVKEKCVIWGQQHADCFCH